MIRLKHNKLSLKLFIINSRPAVAIKIMLFYIGAITNPDFLNKDLGKIIFLISLAAAHHFLPMLKSKTYLRISVYLLIRMMMLLTYESSIRHGVKLVRLHLKNWALMPMSGISVYLQPVPKLD